MKMLPSDPDIQTIVARIRSGDLDLQPDFQRGEVWSDAKKRRLIDTVLRDWHIPPVHVIERPSSHIQEVLDGQQRLVAIRDFVNGLIKVDGTIEPREDSLVAADNSTYETLPITLRRLFDRFTIRVFRLVDFKPDEPGELFYRLNQPTSLTAAEQRNAFFGPVRVQVRELCESFSSIGLSEDFLGFSNSRMAYDDIVAKLLLSIERKNIRLKITAANITERYRSPIAFSNNSVRLAREALKLLGSVKSTLTHRVKFNKATLFSWLWLGARILNEQLEGELVNYFSEFIDVFEATREKLDEGSGELFATYGFPLTLLSIFTNRSSLRVADVSSVLLRDAILAYCFVDYFSKKNIHVVEGLHMAGVYKAWHPLLMSPGGPYEHELLSTIEESSWGALP